MDFLFVFSIFKLFYCCSVTVVCLFSPSQPKPPPSPASTPALGFVHVSFIVVPENTSPYHPFSSPLPLANVRLFSTSMALVIFGLLFSFVDYVPVKGEIIWYLSLTAWLISLSIMLSSSIHDVAKGISSFLYPA